MLSYNVHHGCLDSYAHGMKDAFLNEEEYSNLTQCDTLADFKSQLQITDYGNFLSNESTLTSRIIGDRATQKMAADFMQLRNWADPPLERFLDYLTYEHMISNVLKLMSAKRSGRGDSLDILYRCHPLGLFDGIGSLTAATTLDEMFEVVLIDSPIRDFFAEFSHRRFDELSLEYIKNALQKAFLESFYDVCRHIGGGTAVTMSEVLEFEADRAVITITANTCGAQDLRSEDRYKLFPRFGSLADIHDELAAVQDEEQLRERLKRFPAYYELFDDGRGIEAGSVSLERKLLNMAVDVYRSAMVRPFQLGMFYAWAKLKEVEISNLTWISDCIAQGMKARVRDYVPI